MRFLVYLLISVSCAIASEDRPEIRLWPGQAPGETVELGPEKDTTKSTDGLVAGRPVIRLGNVSQPTITIYKAPNSGSAAPTVMVCPGGAYQILAMDLEGTEVCEWLNSIGVSAALLKYRVPKRAGLERHTAALQDAERALGLVRHRASDFMIDPKRIGVLGFSAGGHLAAALAASSAKPRSYPRVDAADDVSCRPDFSILIYPAYLTLKDENDKINPDVAVSSNTPPTFMAMAEDDGVRVENVLFYAAALKRAKVPCELHVYPSGGHGYGLRKSKEMVTTWPARAADWMRSRGSVSADGK